MFISLPTRIYLTKERGLSKPSKSSFVIELSHHCQVLFCPFAKIEYTMQLQKVMWRSLAEPDRLLREEIAGSPLLIQR